MTDVQPTQLEGEARIAPRRRGQPRVTVERAQLADDAAGRVELLVLQVPADVLEPAEAIPPPAPPPPIGRLMGDLMRGEGWLAAGVLVMALAAVFVIGLWLTR